MTFDTYQAEAHKTAIYPVGLLHKASRYGVQLQHIKEAAWMYPALLLPSEVGELMSHLQKAFRDNDGELPEDKRQLFIKEIGDILWALAEIATCLDMRLDDAAEGNIAKLADRARRGTLQGSGDER